MNFLHTENYFVKSESDLVFFMDTTYGKITADIVHLNKTIFAYSIAPVFNNSSTSDSCTLLLVNNLGKLIAITKFMNRYGYMLLQSYVQIYIHFYRSQEIQNVKLFLATTVSDQNGNVSVNLSMNSELILEEPFSVASVITFGIEGDCILDELIVNASIDDIYGNNCNYNMYLLYLATYN